MHRSSLTVYIIDDDPAVRDSIALMLGLGGYRTASFPDAEAFETARRADWAGCVVADVRLPGRSGLQLMEELRLKNVPLPFVIITAHGDVPTARAAFLGRAVDFLEKPFSEQQLFGAIEAAFDNEATRVGRAAQHAEDTARLARLTPREREVLELAALGRHAKEIAAALNISPRTVEVHKAHVMDKLGVRNGAELVRFALRRE